VDVGKVIIIEKKNHPKQKTWHTVHGYDTGLVSPEVGMEEEDCVYNPKIVKGHGGNWKELVSMKDC
jgi:hypothetical protein